MRNRVLGSESARGKKKRKNIRKFTPRTPSTEALTKRRRRMTTLCGSESAGSLRMLKSARESEGFDCGGGVVFPAGDSGVGFAITFLWTGIGRPSFDSERTVKTRWTPLVRPAAGMATPL